MYFVQHCYSLFNEGIEDTVFEKQLIRRSIGIDLSAITAPYATTLLRSYRRLEIHSLSKVVFDIIDGDLAAKGLPVEEGNFVNPTIIAERPSAMNRAEECDLQMH